MGTEIEAKSPGHAYLDPKIRGFLESVNQSSAAASAAWVFFIAAMAYFLVALAGVTHEDFLLNTPVNQPILQVEIDLQSFFLFAPVVLVFFHFGLLIQHEILASKARALDHAMLDYEGAEGYRNHPIRRQVHSYFFTQSITGPRRSKILFFFLNAMSWTSLFLLPIFTLLAFQITYLPYHDSVTTTWHQIYLLVDVLLFASIRLLYTFSSVRFIQGIKLNWRYKTTSLIATSVIAVLAVVFSSVIATIPDSPMDRMTRSIWPAAVPFGQTTKEESEPRRVAFFPTAFLFEGEVDEGKGTTNSLFSRNLIITDKDLVKDKDWNPEETTLALRARNFSYARFDRSDLRGVDFTGAILHGARFYKTNLNSTKFDYAQLQKADMREAFFAGKTSMYKARLDGANLRGAKFDELDLRHAVLVGANLQEMRFQEGSDEKFSRRYLGLSGADLRNAQLQGANLSRGVLRGANFQGANLIGVNLQDASLEGADFTQADLSGAQLDNASLSGARFVNSNMQGVSLAEAKLYAVDFTNANMQAANLRKANIWMTSPLNPGQISIADLSDLKLVPAQSYYSEYRMLRNIESDDLRATVQNRLGLLLNYQQKRNWQTSKAYTAWQALNNTTPDEGLLSNFYSSVVCNDTSREAFLSQAYVVQVDRIYRNYASLIDYKTYNSPINPERFLNEISIRGCVGAQKVSAKAMYNLMNTVTRYRENERKVKAWREKNAAREKEKENARIQPLPPEVLKAREQQKKELEEFLRQKVDQNTNLEN